MKEEINEFVERFFKSKLENTIQDRIDQIRTELLGHIRIVEKNFNDKL